MQEKHQLAIDPKTNTIAVVTTGATLSAKIIGAETVEVDKETAERIRDSIRNPKLDVRFNPKTGEIVEKKIKVKDIVETEDTTYNLDKPKQKKET